MVLAEVLIEKDNLKTKIKQLEEYLFKIAVRNSKLADRATSKLLDLIDKYRSHLILINKVSNETNVSIGGSNVSLANAVLIAKTMERKIDLINRLIDSEDVVLDIFDLMDQRDKLLDEYTTISNSLKAIEWDTKVD